MEIPEIIFRHHYVSHTPIYIYMFTISASILFTHRRSSILSHTCGTWRRMGPTDTGQCLVCGGIELVLVYYASRIPNIALFEQYRSLSVSHCRHSLIVCNDAHWTSVRLWMECSPCNDPILLYMKQERSVRESAIVLFNYNSCLLAKQQFYSVLLRRQTAHP